MSVTTNWFCISVFSVALSACGPSEEKSSPVATSNGSNEHSLASSGNGSATSIGETTSAAGEGVVGAGAGLAGSDAMQSSPGEVAPRKILWGVNGHDGRVDYDLKNSEAVFKLLRRYNLKTYRFDVQHTDHVVLDTLIPLANRYNVQLRPMLERTTKENAYGLAKRYANDIRVWEVDNERGETRAKAEEAMPAMVATAQGIKQAAEETGIPLKTSINIMACNSYDPESRCAGDPNGDMWFLDMAREAGFEFDYVTFHYYPSFLDSEDEGLWYDRYLGQMRAASEKYRVHIFLNETHCGEIGSGSTTDSGRPGDRGCYDGMSRFFTEIRNNYSDIVDEVNMYELLDEPNLEVDNPTERHYGVRKSLNEAKPIFGLLAQMAR
jgi:hypothetical protein